MIFVLPFVARLLHLPTGVGGAWIGTSEFADAAGFAAAQAYGDLAGHGASPARRDQSLFAFTLMKVVGRDVWIGIWAFVLAIVATTRWEQREPGRKANAARDLVALSEIRHRLPRRLAAHHLGHQRLQPRRLQQDRRAGARRADQGSAHLGLHLLLPQHRPDHAVPRSGARPAASRSLAFSAGVVVNVILGFILSAVSSHRIGRISAQ